MESMSIVEHWRFFFLKSFFLNLLGTAIWINTMAYYLFIYIIYINIIGYIILAYYLYLFIYSKFTTWTNLSLFF